jgi:hypothetical protein
MVSDFSSVTVPQLTSGIRDSGSQCHLDRVQNSMGGAGDMLQGQHDQVQQVRPKVGQMGARGTGLKRSGLRQGKS